MAIFGRKWKFFDFNQWTQKIIILKFSTSKNLEKHILSIMKAFNEAYNLQTFQKEIFRKIKKIEILKKKIFLMIFRISKKINFLKLLTSKCLQK